MNLKKPFTTTTPELWFSELEECFENAARTTGKDEHWYQIGGLTMRLSFAGASLQKIVCPAFEHLLLSDNSRNSKSVPDISIQLFNAKETELTLPGSPAKLQDFSPRGDIRGFNSETCKVAFQPFGKVISTYLVEMQRAVVCFGELDEVLNFERAAPMRALLGWIMRGFGKQLVHAAVVSHHGQGILLGGKSGSGKSNTALACLSAGLEYLSDDFCAVACEPKPTAYSLFSTARTLPKDQERLPFLDKIADRSDPRPQEKELYLLNRNFPGSIVSQCQLRAIVLPEIGSGSSIRLEPISRREALLALAPVTTTILPDAGPEVISSLSALVRSLPTYRLHLGSNIENVPPFIRETLIRLSAEKNDPL